MNYTNLLLAIVLAGCSSGAQTETKEKVKSGFNVKTEIIRSYDGLQQLRYSGVVEAKQVTPLSFGIPGTVNAVYVEEGQQVKKGQLLARLDPTSAKNRHSLALQKQKQAQDAYDRMKPMKENGTLPEIKWVEIETGLDQTNTTVAITQQGVNDCNLYAAVDGIVGDKSIVPGMNIIPATTVIELLNIKEVYVKIPVPENEIGAFSKGQPATITIGALSKIISGNVKEIGVSADFLSHTYPVRIEVDNSGLSIKPGMVCSVKTNIPDAASGYLISNKALQIDLNGDQFVFVCKKNRAEKRAVKTISLIDGSVLVSGYLKKGEQVVVSGQDKLKAGDLVNVIR